MLTLNIPKALKQSICYVLLSRRCPDIEGTWKVVNKEGEFGFLDACGEPEPMKVTSPKFYTCLSEMTFLGKNLINHFC